MISNNTFTLYETVKSRNELENFINEGTPVISNHDKWEDQIKHLADYKDEHKKEYKQRKNGRTYNNNYAYNLVILIPFEVEKENWNDFVKTYMHFIDPRFDKKLLWICKYKTINFANFAEIICFQRKVYKTPKRRKKKYNRDYYYDSQTGKTCKPFSPNAVLKAKKGQCYIDKKTGEPVTKLQHVKDKEERIFVYKNFDSFIYKLKSKYIKAKKEFLPETKIYQLISRITIKNEDSDSLRKNKIKKNGSINEINKIFMSYQDGINNGGFSNIEDIYKLFRQLLNDVDEMIHHTNQEFEKIKFFMREWWIKNIADDYISDM